MLTHDWLQSADGLVEIYPATNNVINNNKLPLATSYEIRKPDGGWSLAVIK